MTRCGSLLAVVVAVAACTPAPTPVRTITPAAEPTASTATPTIAAPTPAPTAASIALPNPGGTCDAAQFDMAGPTILSGASATMGTQHVVIYQQLVNAGNECDLAQPAIIGLEAATGPAMAVAVPNLGHTVCEGTACQDVYPTSTTVPAGASAFITINAWWWLERIDPTLPSPRPCGPAIANVARAVVPFAVGHVVLDWHDVLKELCTDPPSFSIGIALASELRGRLPDDAPPPCRDPQITLTPGASGVATGTAYLRVEARNVSGADCLLAREPAVSISVDGGVELASGVGFDPASNWIAPDDTAAYYLGWNMPCLPLPTGALIARVEFSADLIIDMPLGDFGPSCVDGSTGVVFMETESP